MKTNLQHKGWRGTRMQWALILFIASTAALVYTDLKPTEWLDFLKWLFGIYATSEGIAKSAEAVRDRPTSSPTAASLS